MSAKAKRFKSNKSVEISGEATEIDIVTAANKSDIDSPDRLVTNESEQRTTDTDLSQTHVTLSDEDRKDLT